jgi:hypothetical protein
VVTGSDDIEVPNPTGEVSSDDALDILRVRFEATREGLVLTMTLAGPYRDDATYDMHVVDAKTGCDLMVYVGGGDPDGYFNSCDDAGGFHYLPPVVDPSQTVLQARLPWDMFPRDVSPRHTFRSLSGLSRVTNAAGGYRVADRAVTQSTLGPAVR